MYSLVVYVKKGLLLHVTYPSKILRILIDAFDWVYFVQCLTYFFFFYRSSSCLCIVLYAFSSNIRAVLSINLSANVVVFGGLNAYQKDYFKETKFRGN